MKTLIKNIAVEIELLNIVDYNNEYGFEAGDDNYIENWVCANVAGSVGDYDFVGQVQYDNTNREYSADCDGNVLYDEIKTALLRNYDHDELYEKGMNKVLNCEYETESDLYHDLVDGTLPEIVKFVCEFGADKIKKYENE